MKRELCLTFPHPNFTNEKAAITHIEASRWSAARIVDRSTFRRNAGRIFPLQRLPRQVHRAYRTVMERSHIPVHKWLLAISLMSASKKSNRRADARP